MAKMKLVKGDKKFVNPYTFISIDGNKNESSKISQNNEDSVHTGYLQCRLITKTPLIIPDTEKVCEATIAVDNKKYKMEKYTFHKVGEKYVIPGSSLRGMLRSVYETVTNSCMSTMRENERLSKRIEAKEAYQAGILINEENGWELYEAKKYLIPFRFEGKTFMQEWKYLKDNHITLDKLKYDGVYNGKERFIKSTESDERYCYGDKVEFSLFDISTQYKGGIWNGIVRNMHKYNEKSGETTNNSEAGYIFMGEEFSRKHGEEIFVKTDNIIKNIDVKMAMEYMEESIGIYRNNSINKSFKKGHTGYVGYEEAKKRGVIPVWYNKDSGMLSMASVGRTVYKHSLNDLVKDKSPCVTRDDCCRACGLFGMVGKEALGSKIRITDAELIEKETDNLIYDVVLKEQALPRYTYLPFYAEYANHDVYNHKTVRSYDDKGVIIRGRKYYWHNPAVLNKDGGEIYRATNEEIQDENKRRRLKAFDILKAEREFDFKIYYDNITQTQLDELMWCITVGENTEYSCFCHKLGHGKPYGLGSVKVLICEKHERIIGKKYSEEENCLYSIETEEFDIGKENNLNFSCIEEKLHKVEELRKVCNMETVQDMDVRYPYVESKVDDIPSFQWFASNKKDASVQLLPDVLDKEQELFTFKEDVFVAKVTGYHPNKTVAYFDERHASLHASIVKQFLKTKERVELKKVLPIGTKCELRYEGETVGEDGKKHKKYALVEIIGMNK